MIHRHALPAFLTISVLLHGIVAVAWRGPAMPVPRMGTSLRVSLLPANPDRVHQTTRAANGGRGPQARSGILRPVHDTHALVRASRARRDTTAGKQAGQRASRKMAARVSARAQGTAAGERLRHALSRYFYYPELAIRYGWQGTVKIGVRLSRDGTVSDVHLVHSSGYAVLDDAALRSTRSIHSVGGFDGASARDHFDVQLPVVYRLAES